MNRILQPQPAGAPLPSSIDTARAAAPKEPVMAGATTKSVSTFWHGSSLSGLDVACLLSFVHHGFDVTLYSYAPMPGLPEAIRVADAAEIVDPRFLEGFVVLGRPSLSHFSDLFRYRLFQLTGSTWIDTDLVCLKDFALPRAGNLFAYETDIKVNGAIMRIDPEEPGLPGLIEETERYAFGRSFAWGATGPTLLSRQFGSGVFDGACPAHVYYPVHWDDWWKPFHPTMREATEELCARAHTLHLWNNIVEKSGYWKDLAPPVGSYLHDVFKRQGTLGVFKDTYPEQVVDYLSRGYVNTQTADHMTVRQLVGITIPRALAGVRKRLTQR
ncbi:hypothetical protein [Chthonobacter rhizosphaerae]|uniref:hypothetical protein n=1 Tax=Chthonobacter rhizosphaerae TaxID=2735553 RepID=UPI0015EEAA89|nr:hypothetical protein [Chthonobacter rhizosphaerae]